MFSYERVFQSIIWNLNSSQRCYRVDWTYICNWYDWITCRSVSTFDLTVTSINLFKGDCSSKQAMYQRGINEGNLWLSLKSLKDWQMSASMINGSIVNLFQKRRLRSKGDSYFSSQFIRRCLYGSKSFLFFFRLSFLISLFVSKYHNTHTLFLCDVTNHPSLSIFSSKGQQIHQRFHRFFLKTSISRRLNNHNRC